MKTTSSLNFCAHTCAYTSVVYKCTHMYVCECMCVYVCIKVKTPYVHENDRRQLQKNSRLFPSRLRQIHFAVYIYVAYSKLSSPPVRVTYLPQEHWEYRQPIFKSDFYIVLWFSDSFFLVAWQARLPSGQSPQGCKFNPKYLFFTCCFY